MFEALKILIAVLVLGIALRYLIRFRVSAALILLFGLFFSRFVLASFHSFTYPNIIGPFSIMSLTSILSLGLCVVLLPLVKPADRPGLVISKSLFTIYCLIALMLLSAVVNNTVSASLPSLIKWLYLLQLVSLITYALTLDGLLRTLKVTLLAYSFPVIMLLLSIVFGVSKRSELDGSTSFVGGFFHEAVFSTVIFTAAFFCLVFLNASNDLKSRRNSSSNLVIGLVLGFFLVLMMFINYRTSIIAFILMTAAYFLFSASKAKFHHKALISVCLTAGLIWVFSFGVGSSSDRFADLPNAYNNASELITYPENYTRDDRRLFSGRLYMWSAYLSEASEGSPLQLLIGRGMGSWKDFFEKYAHNTFVSFYFELGVLGLCLCLTLFLVLLRMLNRIDSSHVRACCVSFLLGFLVLNLSTMPMWSMEGIYCLAFLLALGRQAVSQRMSFSNAVRV